MAKNVCPTCREVILTLEDETIVTCIKCETIFDSGNETDEDSPDRKFKIN